MLGVSSVLAGGMLAVVSTALASLPATASKGLTVRAAAAVKPRPKANQCPPTFRVPAWHTRSVLRTRTTLIFGVTSPALWGERYSACFRPRGAGVFLGSDGPIGATGPSGTTDEFAIAGTFAAAYATYGEATYVECEKYNYANCQPPTAWISVANVRSLRHATVRVPFVWWRPPPADVPVGPENVPLAISLGGGLAWLEPGSAGGEELWATMLIPAGRHGFSTSPTMIDAGTIAFRSLRFINAHTVTWTNNGVSHQQAIG